MKSWLTRMLRSGEQLPQTIFSAVNTVELPFHCEDSRDGTVPNRQKILRQLQTGCQRQLEILRRSLTLTTAVLLWSDNRTGQLFPYAFSTISADFKDAPFLLGTGMIGALQSREELSVASLPHNSPKIPYYRSNIGVGSFVAVKLNLPETSEQHADSTAILCVDRLSDLDWTENERFLLKISAEQLSSEIYAARQLFAYDRERHTYRRAFDSLRRLNTALGLDSVYTATAEAVRSIVPADFFSVCLVESDNHRICYVQGDHADKLTGQVFSLEQSLVGQVIKYRRTLPENANYQGTTAVFSEEHLFAAYRSLLIVPLKQENGPVVGALCLAAKKPEVFTRSCREILELLATQVAIKIELANSHEQINRMATLDSLTGIANRRAYQRGFEAMLERAKRRPGSLHLILCDIDHFKKINDSFGHPFGDEVLRQVAKLFARVTRSVDLAARTGGEEFAILLEDTDNTGAWKVAERLRELVEQLNLSTGKYQVSVTVSLGIAAFPLDANSLDKLVSCADQALYMAKSSGRNKTVTWDSRADKGKSYS